MKRAFDFLEKWQRRYANVCIMHKGGYEKMPTFCWCGYAAQVAAYIEAIIPEDYQSFEFSNFDGYIKTEKLISDSIIYQARQAIIKYCWENISEEDKEEFDLPKWFMKSTMEKRRELGQSIIIYGDPRIVQMANGKMNVNKKSLGRTLLATIIMKEAIRTRLKPNHLADSYAWISYSSLSDKLMKQAMITSHNPEYYDPYIIELEECDWLCVDNIEIDRDASDASRSFRNKVVDSFFETRINKGLPNVLVFQDDLNKIDDIRREFGTSINTIINSNKTHQVKLSEGKK